MDSDIALMIRNCGVFGLTEDVFRELAGRGFDEADVISAEQMMTVNRRLAQLRAAPASRPGAGWSLAGGACRPQGACHFCGLPRLSCDCR